MWCKWIRKIDLSAIMAAFKLRASSAIRVLSIECYMLMEWLEE